jgi:predicted GNAT family acetyltransferase
MTEQAAVVVRRNEPLHRYEAELDGTIVGTIQYRLQLGTVILVHTETDAAYGGRGIGSTLAQTALEDLKSRGEKAVVLCPFINAWLTKHPDAYTDVVATDA